MSVKDRPVRESQVPAIDEPATQQRVFATTPACKPQVISDGQLLRRTVHEARRRRQTVGLVPTMGALHDGHLSLVDAARAECDLSVVTIYVNPTQFAPNEDFQEYPRELTRDLSLLAGRGCDLVFAPSNDSIYRPNHSTFVDVGPIGTMLEGEFRPTHFRGVATVVLKLLQLAPVDRAYFGRKDYQQTLVIRQMVDDLDVPIEIRVCPIIREADGLAMSSRNRYLTPDERSRALVLFRSLQLGQELVRTGEREVAAVRARILSEIDKESGVQLQYVEFLRDGSMTPVMRINGPTTIVVAATVGKTRLIDNVLVGA